ncbi:MAG: putative N-acetylmannosamine-6-phosphate 2-epimerase [Devosia sp.]|nr:putative N-acetylmannosamine-6-phosphate 2-epimerase [Devosia sp.]
MQREVLKQALIVSCQPVPGGPMDNTEMVTGFALAALNAGATALRIESIAYLRAVRAATNAPIVGIIKRDLPDTAVRITPWLSDAEALADAGADIVAFDATDRPRPASIQDLTRVVKARAKLVMADCSCLDDARAALAAGVDFVGTTLSGYVGGPEPSEPDLALIEAMRRLTPFVIAEGCIRTTDQAAAAVRAGAYAVVVGSAITRTEHVTAWFRAAVDAANAKAGAAGQGVLAIDIGGTKILAALVENGQVTREELVPTNRDEGPDAWIASIAERVRDWRGEFDRVAVAATGLITNGYWSALNPVTLGIPQDYPLADRLAKTFGAPAFAANDAQAAAWGEHRFGAGEGQDVVFLTISTGIGGGVVINGKPLLGLGGHFGLLRGPSQGASPLEDEVSGRWIAAEAGRAGHPVDTPLVFAAARGGEAWATDILTRSARKVALLCQDIQLMFDPKRIVVGGGIGLATGYLDLVRAQLPQLQPRLLPTLVAAKLGSHAGVVGVADLALTER